MILSTTPQVELRANTKRFAPPPPTQYAGFSLQVTAGGTWRLRFYDVWGEDWITDPMTFNGDGSVADCATLVAMLEAIPNDVIDDSTVLCVKDGGQYLPAGKFWMSYEIKLLGNPGAHKVPEVIVLDDAGRHTLRSVDNDGIQYTGLEKTVVYDTGITGEFHEFFGKKCGITVSISEPADFYASTVADGGYQVADATLEVHYGEVQRATVASGTLRTLKECLSDSDGVPSNNVGVENWDMGNVLGDFGPVTTQGQQLDGSGNLIARDIRQSVPGQFPHLVKLVKVNPDSEYDGGVYTIMTWHPDDENFVLSAAVDDSAEYQVCVLCVYCAYDSWGSLSHSLERHAYRPGSRMYIVTSKHFLLGLRRDLTRAPAPPLSSRHQRKYTGPKANKHTHSLTHTGVRH